MAVLPFWAVGRHITAFTLTPQTVNATTGALTDTTPVAAMFGHLQDVEVESRNTVENISSMDRQFENNVIIERGTTYRCTELGKSVGTNLLAQGAYGFDYFKVALARGAQTWTGYGVVGNFSMKGNKQRVTESFELMPVDIGSTSANPVYG